LTKTEGDQENDGLLEAREIMDMNLPADLAVLSACETANGKISPAKALWVCLGLFSSLALGRW